MANFNYINHKKVVLNQMKLFHFYRAKKSNQIISFYRTTFRTIMSIMGNSNYINDKQICFRSEETVSLLSRQVVKSDFIDLWYYIRTIVITKFNYINF